MFSFTKFFPKIVIEELSEVIINHCELEEIVCHK